MNRDEFIQKVIDEFENYLPRSFDDVITIERCSVMKANDMKYEGILIRKEGSNIAPNFYLNEMYEEYEKGKPFEELMYNLIASYLASGKMAPPQAAFESREAVSGGICGLRLLGKKRNISYLKDNAWKDFAAGLVMTADFLVIDEDTGEWRVKVSKEMLNSIGVPQDEFFEDICMANSVNFPAVLMPVTEGAVRVDTDINLLNGDFEVGKCPMYILTTERQTFGASAMLYDGVLEEVGRIVGGDYYVIPSSVHEVMILPVRDEVRPELVQKAIRDANRNSLPPDDVLTDDLLYYSCSRKRLTTYAKRK